METYVHKCGTTEEPKGALEGHYTGCGHRGGEVGHAVSHRAIMRKTEKKMCGHDTSGSRTVLWKSPKLIGIWIRFSVLGPLFNVPNKKFGSEYVLS